MIKLLKDPRGAIITLLNFECHDDRNERGESCNKIKFDKNGNETGVFYQYVGGSYWETFKPNKGGLILERPKLGDLSKAEYYLKVLDLARADNYPPIVINDLIGCYELVIKHEKQTKRLEYELKNNID